MRQIDVIDVNRRWSVWVGNRRHGYRIGTVKGHDYRSARREAKEQFPRVGFLEEER